MTATVSAPTPPVAPSAPAKELELGSLAEQVAQRAKARAKQRQTILTIPIPGFEDLFAIQYRRLTFEEKSALVERHNVIDGDARERIESAADMLINACEDVVQVTGHDEHGKPSYRSLQTRLTSAFVGRLFGLEPVPSTARDALILALDSEDLVTHFGQYIRAVDELDRSEVEGLPGESRPSAGEG
jgi:hypothetical protein